MGGDGATLRRRLRDGEVLEDPRPLALVERALAAVRAQGKAAAVPVAGARMVREYAARGASCLTTNDIRLLLDSARELLTSARGAR